MNKNAHPLKRLLAYGRQYRGQTWQAAISSVFNKLCDVAPEILIGMAVDVVVKKQDSFIATLGIRDVEQQLVKIPRSLSPSNSRFSVKYCKVN